MSSQFHPQALPGHTLELVNQFQTHKPVFINDFYLTGGTALSLYLGHRESEDLDFFSPQSFDPIKIQQQLETFGELSQLQLEKGTLNTYLRNVKLQFLEYPYKMLKPLEKWDNLSISAMLDIACTKLQTIGMRGSKKDFVDLYFLLQEFSLTELFEQVEKKYPKVQYSKTHILKSLIYFEDAEAQPMPRMHQEVKWSEVKASMIQKVKAVEL